MLVLNSELSSFLPPWRVKLLSSTETLDGGGSSGLALHTMHVVNLGEKGRDKVSFLDFVLGLKEPT